MASLFRKEERERGGRGFYLASLPFLEAPSLRFEVREEGEGGHLYHLPQEKSISACVSCLIKAAQAISLVDSDTLGHVMLPFMFSKLP